jgi:hypothetical protein
VSYSGVFVGYSGGGHRVLVDGTNKVQVCRDVVFLEKPASRAELRSSEPAPKRKSAGLGVDVKKKADVGAMLMPIHFSSSENNCCDLFLDDNHVPAAPPVPEEPEQSEAEETSADEVEFHRSAQEDQDTLPQEPAVLPDGPHHPT